MLRVCDLRKTTLWAASLAAASWVTACGTELPLENLSCPCAPGWVCCAGDNVCVRNGTSCGGSDGGSDGGEAADGSSPDAAIDAPALTVTPAAPTVNTLKTVQFTANRVVHWSVDEGAAGGTIDASGRYVPAAKPGTYHVTATADDGMKVSAIVTIAPLSLDLVAGGLGGNGDADGIGADARFGPGIKGLTSDALARSVFVADRDNHIIRKIDAATHEVSTFAGKAGVEGTEDGIGPAALLSFPDAMALDGDSLFVASSMPNHDRRIRRINLTTGAVSALAGRTHSTCEVVDGVGSAASLCEVRSLVSGGNGVLYFADYEWTLRKVVVSTGDVTTVAGAWERGVADGIGAAARFRGITGLAALPYGTNVGLFDGPTLFILDDCNGDYDIPEVRNGSAPIRAIRSLDPRTGAVSTLGGFTNASDGSPWGLLEPSTPVYYDGSVYVTARDRFIDTLFGIRLDSPTYPVSQLPYPTLPGEIASVLAEDIYGILVGTFEGTVSHFIPGLTGTNVVFAGRAGQAGKADGPGDAARFERPKDISVDSAGIVYVCDEDHDDLYNSLRLLDLKTRQVTTPYLGTSFEPGSIVALGGSLIYVQSGRLIYRRKDDGSDLLVAGSYEGSGCTDGVGQAAHFEAPEALATDLAGAVFVTDGFCGVRRVDLGTGEVKTILKDYLVGSFGRVSFEAPRGIVVGEGGDLYVTDNNRLIKVSNGIATVVAGDSSALAAQRGMVDGDAASSRLSSPSRLARDPAGQIYISDAGNGAIRRFDPRTGLLETIVGTGRRGVKLGAAPALNEPWGLAFTQEGDLLVVDRAENSVLMLR